MELKKPLKIILSANPKVIKVFNNFEEIEQWIEFEASQWSWIVETSTPVWQYMRNFFDGLRSTYSRIKSSENAEQLDKALHNFSQHILESDQQGGVVISDTPQGKFILKVKERDGDQVASGALNYLLGFSIPTQWGRNIPEFVRDTLDSQIRGFIKANDFKNGLKSTSAHRESFEQLIHSLTDRTEAIFQKLNDGLATYKTDYEKHSSDLKTLSEGLADGIKSAEEVSEKSLSDLNDRALEVERIYREKVQLQAPVQYFESQFKSHNILSWIYLAIFSVGTGAFLWSFYKLITFLFSSAQGMKEVEKYLLLAGFFTFGTWGVRILYKMFLNHQHLKTVAGEKGLLIKVYLSLLEKDTGLSKEDRALILAPLFKVPQNVFSKDDSASASPVEILMRNLHR